MGNANGALVIYPSRVGCNDYDPDNRLAEAVGLTQALDLQVLDAQIVPIRSVRAASFFGTGHMQRIGADAHQHGAGVVIIDDHITPGQQRTLEKEWNTKVVDRTGLILEIFALRARTKEGRLQVELARLEYERSRLVRTWTHLERQKGGFGFMGGPGETQIEADRRQLRTKITRLKKELKDVQRTRGLHRKARKKIPYPIVALVGYTNAGKSTLFNAITGADVLAKDMLFATLDPTLRGVILPSGRKVILSDTVGFIIDLPTELVAAFRATLEEVTEADLILHMRDISSANSAEQAKDVDKTLSNLLEPNHQNQNVLEVWNKIDLLDTAQRDDTIRNADTAGVMCTSAVTGAGIPELLSAINKLVFKEKTHNITTQTADGKERAWLMARGHVQSFTDLDDGRTAFVVGLTDEDFQRYSAAFTST